MKQLEYLIMNPVYNKYKYIPLRKGWTLQLNMFNEIVYVEDLLPIKLYHNIKDDLTNINDYNLNHFINFD